jgi:hypothetical protein
VTVLSDLAKQVEEASTFSRLRKILVLTRKYRDHVGVFAKVTYQETEKVTVL